MFRSRDFALVAVFAAIFISYGYVSSVNFRAFTLSLDLFFLIAAMFAILAMMVERSGAPLLLGTVTGLILLGSPAPATQHIAASLIANGLVFDLALRATSRIGAQGRTHIIIANSLGNFAMAAVGLLLIQVSGVSLPEDIWGIRLAIVEIVSVKLVIDTVAGAVGGVFGLSVVRRIRSPANVARQL